MSPRAKPDPTALAVFHALFASVAEEMGVTLGRTAHSPNIKERRDYSCALFDARGKLVAQAAHIPVHLGAMPLSVEAVLPLAPFAPGDVIILNDPYLGGTHLPDITLVSPVFLRERQRREQLVGFVVSRAHHADVGGMTPGSMPLATELYQEGVIIPPLHLVRRGRRNREVLALLLRNVRTPDERLGDLDAQLAAQRTGEARLLGLIERYGRREVARQVAALQEYAERLTRAAIRRIPNGAYTFEDALDDDGLSDDPVPIRLKLTVRGGHLHFDFTGSAAERPSSVNAVAAVTRSAVYYVVRCLLDEGAPTNDGCLRPVSFTLPEGSIVNARPPRAVSAGNVETSQRIVDVVLGALAKAGARIPAASAGTMNNVTIGGDDPARGRPFAYYETLAGGAGAGPARDGLSAAHSHMTNTMNTPVEALELAYPFRVREYAVRRGTGGSGRHRGGNGLVREYEFLTPAQVTIVGERRRRRPWGLRGGAPGEAGRDTLIEPSGRRRRLRSKAQFAVPAGARLRIETPGGGGWGRSGRRRRRG